MCMFRVSPSGSFCWGFNFTSRWRYKLRLAWALSLAKAVESDIFLIKIIVVVRSPRLSQTAAEGEQFLKKVCVTLRPFDGPRNLFRTPKHSIPLWTSLQFSKNVKRKQYFSKILTYRCGRLATFAFNFSLADFGSHFFGLPLRRFAYFLKMIFI